MVCTRQHCHRRLSQHSLVQTGAQHILRPEWPLARDAGTHFATNNVWPDGDSLDPPFTHCPDCHEPVLSCRMPLCERQDALTLHRLAACSRTDSLRDWFHAAALRSVPMFRITAASPSPGPHAQSIASRPPPGTVTCADDALFHPP
jgi:hypothetical protein